MSEYTNDQLKLFNDKLSATVKELNNLSSTRMTHYKNPLIVNPTLDYMRGSFDTMFGTLTIPNSELSGIDDMKFTTFLCFSFDFPYTSEPDKVLDLIREKVEDPDSLAKPRRATFDTMEEVELHIDHYATLYKRIMTVLAENDYNKVVVNFRVCCVYTDHSIDSSMTGFSFPVKFEPKGQSRYEIKLEYYTRQYGNSIEEQVNRLKGDLPSGMQMVITKPKKHALGHNAFVRLIFNNKKEFMSLLVRSSYFNDIRSAAISEKLIYRGIVK